MRKSKGFFYGLFNGKIDTELWNVARYEAISTNLGGSKDPDFLKFADNGSGSQGVFAYHFDKSQEQELYQTVTIPRMYKEGTNIYPFIHWMPKDSGTGTVRWAMEFSNASIGEVFGNTVFIYKEQSGEGTALIHQVAIFDGVGAAGFSKSGMGSVRVFRDATHENDTYDADAILVEFGFVYEMDSVGTSTLDV